MKSYIKSFGFLILFFFLVGNCYSFAKNKEIKTQCIEIKSPQNDSLYCKFTLRDLKLDTTFVFKTGNIDSVLSCRNDYDWKKISSDIIIAQQANVDKSAYTYLYLAEEYHKMRNTAITAPLAMRRLPLLSRCSPCEIILPNQTTGCGNRDGSPMKKSNI